ncbi:COX15/CtaA family protein [Mucilaginibacter sp.]
MIDNTAKRRFQQVNLGTVILLFVLILAGGVVRSTGSGMGCPDWPKCFGRYIPPTDVAELPKDYKQTYVTGRAKKNERFAKTLDVFGYSDLASRLRNDQSVLIPEDFNAARTWTEYINRLLGALSGLFLLITTFYSFKFFGQVNLIPALSIFNLLLVGFQGWLGSIVVSTNLVAWIVTVHMLLALAIVAISITTYHLSKTMGKLNTSIPKWLYMIAVIAVVISVIQITLGTEVREQVDAVAGHFEQQYRERWVNSTGPVFPHHRDTALLVLVANVLLYFLVRRYFNRHSLQQQLMSIIFLLIILQIGTGVALSYLALPPAAQAVHILLASLMFGAQVYLLLNLYKSVNVEVVRR